MIKAQWSQEEDDISPDVSVDEIETHEQVLDVDIGAMLKLPLREAMEIAWRERHHIPRGGVIRKPLKRFASQA
jgi:hypothetical protein